MTLATRLSVSVLVLVLSGASGLQAAGSDDLRLIEALQRRDADAALALLRDGVDVNVRRADGATALAWAAHWDDVDTAARLIEAGADPHAANALGVTPLMLAGTNRSARMATLLLDAGSGPAARRGPTERRRSCTRRGRAPPAWRGRWWPTAPT